MKKLILVFATMFSVAAFADLKPMPQAGQQGDAANIAASVFNVTHFKIGKLAFKLTEFDSALNGDLNVTSILLVGHGEVGGAAGYDAAFLLTPPADQSYFGIRSVKVNGGNIVLKVYDFDGKESVKKYRYDEKTTTLVEVK